jgi:hypothetical protein
MMPAWMRFQHLIPVAWAIALAVAFPWAGASRAQAPERSASSPTDSSAYHSATDTDSASDDLTRLVGPALLPVLGAPACLAVAKLIRLRSLRELAERFESTRPSRKPAATGTSTRAF